MELRAMPDEYLEKNIERQEEQGRMKKHAGYETIVGPLEKLLGPENITCADAECARHGKDLTYHPQNSPDIVVYPSSIQQVQEIVRLCSHHKIPVIAFGRGSSLEGHITAPRGGVSLDTKKMNKIVKINVDDRDCVVQPGVTRNQLNQQLKAHNLFFPVDPGADAAIGGMIGTNASGPTALFYGAMKDHVISLKAVLMDGTLVCTGKRARKTSAGYNLTQLFVGSEGTLGIVVELTLRVHVMPKCVASGIFRFPTVKDATTTVIRAIQSAIPLARCELLDEVTMQAINKFNKTNFEEVPTLFVELHGGKKAVEEQKEELENVAQGKVKQIVWAKSESEESELWKARYSAWYACPAMRPEARAFATDVVVPISRLAQCIEETKEDGKKLGFTMLPIIGHVGDGNFHAFVLVDMKNKEEVEKAQEFNSRLVRRALSMDGTCTGEHGIGAGKKEFLKEELGESTVQVMKRIKYCLDPMNLLNPGKVVDL